MANIVSMDEAGKLASVRFRLALSDSAWPRQGRLWPGFISPLVKNPLRWMGGAQC